MSDYIDETSLTDEEVAAAIAEAKAKKAAKAAKKAQEKPSLEKAKSLDDESSDALLSESSSAAQLEAEEDESPAVRSAKSFSNAFAAAKKKREQDLLKKKAEREEEETEEEEEEDEELTAEAAVTASDDDEDDAEFETDSEEEEEDDDDDEEDDEEYEDDEDDEEYDEDDDEDEDDDDEDFDNDGIFETDDENGEYNTTVNVDEDDEENEEDDEEEDEDDDDSTFSTKTKVIIGIIIAILVIAIIGAVAFFMRGSGSDKDTSSISSAVDGEVTSVKFAESSISLEVGETKDLKLIVEPENATDKTFKLKSNDETIAKVDAQGHVTGISSGSTTVTATLKSNPTMTASLVVNVIDEEQSTLNIYNKFVNSIIDGSTDIDSDSDTDSETDEENADEEDTDTESDTESDTDTENHAKTPTHKLTGNKIEDLNSDGDLELALYYEPTTDNEEPLVRIFHLVDEDAEEEETDSEEELQYDEYGNIIEPETDSDTETETDTAKSESKAAKKSPTELTLTEIEQYSELYMTCHATLEADSATTPWNTSYLEVKESEQATARVKILSEGYSAPTYTYASEDEEIATVDKQGNIKGIKPGTVFITVSSPLNSDAVAKIKVRVKDDTDLLDDYLADIPVVNNTNDNIFPTETLTGKAIVDIDNDGVSELLLRFRYSDNVETINLIKVENEKCVCYKTYNNLSDLYEYNEGNGSYSNSILVHYTTGVVRMEYKAVVSKEGSKSRTSEEKILTMESGGSLSELVSFRTTTDISTKTVTSEVAVDNTSSTYEEDDTDSEEPTYYEDSDEDNGDDTSSTASYIDEDEDGYDDVTGEYFGSYAAFTFDEIVENNGIDLTNKKPVKKLPQAAGAPEDEDEDEDNGDEDASADDDDEEEQENTTSTVETEVSEETTKYFVNGTPVDRSVYEETLTSYSATYSVWNAWENVY